MHLAIETTARRGSVALMKDDHVIDWVDLDADQRTARTLVPAIDQILKTRQLSGKSIEFVSVAVGPGSFTGLRIGVTTAKTLCYAWKIRLVAVDSLAAIAAAAFDHQCNGSGQNNIEATSKVTVAIDAYRNQVYRGQFVRETLSAQPSDIKVEAKPDFLSRLASDPNTEGSVSKYLAGDAILFGNANFPIGDRTVLDRQCDAIGVGLLGWQAAEDQDWTDPMSLVPKYLKPSAAEENVANDSLSGDQA